MASSAGWFVHSVGTGLREGKRKMNALNNISDSARYARCIQTSKRVRWDLDEDVIRGAASPPRTSSSRTGFPWPTRSRLFQPMKSGL
jgi:hypothetical protein